MKTEISTHLHDPAYLESLYRSNRMAFKQAFNDLLPTIKGDPVADCWHARLNHADESIHGGSRKELLIVLMAAATAGFVVQFPALFGFDKEFFYTRNIGFILLVPLAMYFAWRHSLRKGKLAFLLSTVLASLVFINLLPGDSESDVVVLSSLHVVFISWSVLGFAFGGEASGQRIRFLTFNGDLLVMMALIVISAAILSGITIALFAAIGLHIEDVYFQYVAVTGAVAVPLVACYLIQT